jgi:hypothetical protein
MLEYSKATPAARDVTPPSRIFAKSASVKSSVTSAHGLSSGMPLECVSKWRNVTGGASRVA